MAAARAWHPSARRPRRPVAPAWPGLAGSRRSTSATTAKVRALSMKATGSESRLSSRAAKAGPMKKARLSRLDQALLAGPELRFVLHQAGQVRADRRREEGREAGRDDRQSDDHPDGHVEHHRAGDEQHDQAARDVSDEQHQPSVEAVGDDAGREPTGGCRARCAPRRSGPARPDRWPRPRSGRASRPGTASRRWTRRTRRRAGAPTAHCASTRR